MYEFLCDFPKPQRPAPNGRLSLAEPRFSTNKIVLYKVHLLTSTLGPQHRQQQSQQQGMLQILDANFEEPSEECGPLTSTSSNKIVLNKVDVLNLLTYSTAELQGRRCSGGCLQRRGFLCKSWRFQKSWSLGIHWTAPV